MNMILWITMSIGAVLMAFGFYVSFKEWQAENRRQAMDEILNNNWRK